MSIEVATEGAVLTLMGEGGPLDGLTCSVFFPALGGALQRW